MLTVNANVCIHVNRLQVFQTARTEARWLCIQSAQSLSYRCSSTYDVQCTQSVAEDNHPDVPDVAWSACLLWLLPRGAGCAQQWRLPVPEGPTCACQRRRHYEVRIHAQHAALSSETTCRVPRPHVIHSSCSAAISVLQDLDSLWLLFFASFQLCNLHFYMG